MHICTSTHDLGILLLCVCLIIVAPPVLFYHARFFLTFRRRLPVRGSGSCTDFSISHGPPTVRNGEVCARPATPHRETAAKGEKKISASKHKVY